MYDHAGASKESTCLVAENVSVADSIQILLPIGHMLTRWVRVYANPKLPARTRLFSILDIPEPDI